MCLCIAGIEDLENWHGKPIPKDRVDALLNDLQSQIQSPNKVLSPELPQEDAKPVDYSPIRLPTPPAYKLGDKVTHWMTPCIFFFFNPLASSHTFRFYTSAKCILFAHSLAHWCYLYTQCIAYQLFLQESCLMDLWLFCVVRWMLYLFVFVCIL